MSQMWNIFLQTYLEQYGYMGSDTAITFLSSWPNERALPIALVYFQNALGLTVTGT